MKLLCIVPAIDLRGTTGLVPGYWQLFKALYELGHEVIVTTYTKYGESVDTLWWRTYDPAVSWEVSITRFIGSVLGKAPKSSTAPRKHTDADFHLSNMGQLRLKVIQKTTGDKFKKNILKILSAEENVDAVILFSLPINHFVGLSPMVHSAFGVPVIFFDFDLPASLPNQYFWSNANAQLNWYVNADLSEYDAVCGQSAGGLKYLEKLGAQKTFAIYYGADPSFYSPIQAKQDIDVLFYGYGTTDREKWINELITVPSQKLPNLKFVSRGFKQGTISNLRDFCCRSKISLNIPRETHAEVYASSHSRIFELTSMGCCTVCSPIAGLNEWFEVGKEILVAHDASEACELYQQLVSDDSERTKIGQRARERVLKDHTFTHRAVELLNVINKVR